MLLWSALRMGQEQSQQQPRMSTKSGSKENVEVSPAGERRSGSRLRKPAQQLLRTLTKRANEQEIPSVKKAKVPEGSVSTSQDAQARDRLLSCPDLHHHTESEMVRRLESLLTSKVQPDRAPLPHASLAADQAAMKLFEGANPPKISLSSYLQRMVYYLGGIAENERRCGSDNNVHSDLAVRYVLAAMLYMERIHNRTGMIITLFNVHRMLIAGTMIAAKVLDDYQPNQKYFADLGGVSTLELARLEAAFLQLCDYNVNVDPELFAAKYATALERERVFSDVDEALTLGAVSSPRMPSRSLAMVI